MSDLLEVTDETFDAEIVNADIPALVTSGQHGAVHAGWWARSWRSWPKNMREK